MRARVAYTIIGGVFIYAWSWAYQYVAGTDAQGMLVIATIIAAAVTGRRQSPSRSL